MPITERIVQYSCLLLCTTIGYSAGPTRADIAPEAEMSAYLMTYFKDETHSLYFALSSDGYSFTDVNNGLPVLKGEDVAEQKGIRDPHIARGPNGTFYLAMTDLHIYAKEKGYRETEWHRDGDRYGWGNNRGFVLMTSKDLIQWSKTKLRVDQTFTGLEEIGCAWAPQTIYDADEGKMMLYYTTRFGNGLNKMVYTYMNDDFTEMVTYPQLLFLYPRNMNAIDSDIIKDGEKYHLHYTPHHDGIGVKHATSDKINRGYAYEPEWVDPEPNACEAPNVWKRIGEEKWVLMYDCYGIHPHNLGFSETTDFKTYTDIGRFNEGVMKTTNFSSPKHGSVIHLTKEEADQLAEHWNLKNY